MSSEAVVRCSELATGYSRDAPVLSGVDLEIHRAEVLAVVGGSGSGKSTLLRSIVGLLPPIAGRVFLFGEDLYAASRQRRSELIRRTGTVFQRDALFGSLSVLENVVLPLREFSDLPEVVTQAVGRAKLSLVGLADLAHRMPSDISGGQRKRVALARALVRDPDVLFCDEPTAGLDPVTAANIDRLLSDVRRTFGITVVAITHDVDSVRTIANRAVVLADGRICAEGPVPELEHRPEPYVYDFFHRIELAERARARERV
jgi:phospholipid/cholesterol/gamma-HCH transport system ATP-binding protein